MGTFCAVDDAVLVGLMRQARRRIVLVAPGLSLPVARALGERLQDIDGALDVTVVLDPDEEVCRIGYGEIDALKYLHELGRRKGFWLNSQPGVRVGVLLADDETLVWSPTPRSVETLPASSPAQGTAPNGLRLGTDPAAALARAVATPDSDVAPQAAEIGRRAITPAEVQSTAEALRRNPPIPVDLQRITRVFNSRLQFVELKVKGGRLSQTQLGVRQGLLNADATGELGGLLESRLKAFADLRHEPVPVPAYKRNGEPLYDAPDQPALEEMTESELDTVRQRIEKRFVMDVKGHGRLIEREERAEFEQCVRAYKAQVEAHSQALRQRIEEQAQRILDECAVLIRERHLRGAQRSGSSQPPPNLDVIRQELTKGIQRAKDEKPDVSWIFKDVTYEQTQSPQFNDLLKAAIAKRPAEQRKRLSKWWTDYDAARSRENGQQALFGQT